MRYPYSLDTTESPDTLGLVELTSVAVGYAVADAMMKSAPITFLDVTAASPGKFLIIYTGEVAAVQEAHAAAIEAAGSAMTDTALMFNLSSQVVPAVNRATTAETITDAIGVLETFTAPSAVLAADAAAKGADIRLLSVTLLNGLGGKAVVVLTGDVADVESALAIGLDGIDADTVADTVVIPAIHSGVVDYLPGRTLGIGRQDAGSS